MVGKEFIPTDVDELFCLFYGNFSRERITKLNYYRWTSRSTKIDRKKWLAEEN